MKTSLPHTDEVLQIIAEPGADDPGERLHREKFLLRDAGLIFEETVAVYREITRRA